MKKASILSERMKKLFLVDNKSPTREFMGTAILWIEAHCSKKLHHTYGSCCISFGTYAVWFDNAFVCVSKILTNRTRWKNIPYTIAKVIPIQWIISILAYSESSCIFLVLCVSKLSRLGKKSASFPISHSKFSSLHLIHRV